MTPAKFHDRYGIDPKELRRYLRCRWPHEHNAPWLLDERMIHDALDHFGVASAHRNAGRALSLPKEQAVVVASPQALSEHLSVQSDLATKLLAMLTEPSNAQSPGEFPKDPSAANSAGMYAWWADEHAQTFLGRPLGCVLPALIYVGQAGATQWPSGTSSKATLMSRIRTQHIRGNARSSTFRLTVSALLLTELRLATKGGGRLDSRSNSATSAWIADHLRVAIAPCPDRDVLSDVEAHVVRMLNPPLNLDHCPSTAQRRKLRELRAYIGRT